MLGEYAARQASQKRLLGLSALALVGILLVLYTDFRSVRLTTLVFASLPFAGGRCRGGVSDWRSAFP